AEDALAGGGGEGRGEPARGAGLARPESGGGYGALSRRRARDFAPARRREPPHEESRLEPRRARRAHVARRPPRHAVDPRRDGPQEAGRARPLRPRRAAQRARQPARQPAGGEQAPRAAHAGIAPPEDSKRRNARDAVL